MMAVHGVQIGLQTRIQVAERLRLMMKARFGLCGMQMYLAKHKHMSPQHNLIPIAMESLTRSIHANMDTGDGFQTVVQTMTKMVAETWNHLG